MACWCARLKLPAAGCPSLMSTSIFRQPTLQKGTAWYNRIKLKLLCVARSCAHATRPGHRPRQHRLHITLQAARATPSSSPRSQARGSAMRAVSQATNRCTVADLCLGPNQSPTASLPSLHSGQRQGGMGAHQVVLPPQRAGCLALLEMQAVLRAWECVSALARISHSLLRQLATYHPAGRASNAGRSHRCQARESAVGAVSQATNRCTVADLCLGPNQSPTASLPSLHSGQRQGGMGAHQVVLPPQRAGGGTRSPISKL